MVLRNYKCPWCGEEFSKDVLYIPGNINPKTEKPSRKKAISTQVTCPNCLNFIKTWS